MVVAVGQIGVCGNQEQHRRRHSCLGAYEQREVGVISPGFEPDRIDAAPQRVRQREFDVVRPSSIDHVVIMELQRAVLLWCLGEGVAASIPVAPGHAPLYAIDEASRRHVLKSGGDCFGCEVFAKLPRSPGCCLRNVACVPRCDRVSGWLLQIQRRRIDLPVEGQQRRSRRPDARRRQDQCFGRYRRGRRGPNSPVRIDLAIQTLEVDG